MKNILIITILSLGLVYVNAQPPGGGRPPRGERPEGGNVRPPKFESKRLLGVMYYDSYDVINEVKLKDETKQQQLTNVILKYNMAMENLYYANKSQLDSIETDVNSQHKVARENKVPFSIDNLQEMINEEMAPLKKEAEDLDKSLDVGVKSLLSEKQFEKWSQYKVNKKEALKPKPQNQNNNMQGQGRGQGRSRGM